MTTITFKARKDLIFSKIERASETSWIAKDPLSLAFVELSPVEFQVIQCFHSAATLYDVREAMESKFPERSFSFHDIQAMVMGLCGNGLLITSLPGAADRLSSNEKKRRWLLLWKALTNIFAIRLPGIYADKFLTAMYGKLFFLFSPWFFVLTLGVFCYSLLVVFAHWDEFVRKVPQLSFFFGLDNLPYLLLVMLMTKSIHELGHGLACKHFKVDCPEIGVMLLFFLPAMYCDTTDSWRLKNKWHRVVIGVAGIYMELILASLAVIIWWNTAENWLHYLAINIVFISSVSTVLFNANPLMRYDGYYVLSDIVEVSNLGSKASQAFWEVVRTRFLGYEAPNLIPKPRTEIFFLVLYAVSSFVYRMTVYCSMVWMVRDTFSMVELKSVAAVLIAIWILGMVFPLLVQFQQFLRKANFQQRPRMEFVLSSFIGIAAVVVFLAYVPLPTTVWAPITIAPIACQTVSIEDDGLIELGSSEPGHPLNKGAKILRISNVERDIEVARVESEIEKFKGELEILRLSPSISLFGGKTRGEIDAELTKAKRQRDILIEKLRRRDIVASMDGVLISSQNVMETERAESKLRTLEGTIFDPENKRCFVPQGATLLHVIPRRHISCSFFIDEKNVKRIQKGQRVKILFFECRTRIVEGVVMSIANRPVESIPRELSLANGGFIPVDPKSPNVLQPMGAWHEGTIEIDLDCSRLSFRSSGQARIDVGSVTALERVYQTIVSLFLDR